MNPAKNGHNRRLQSRGRGTEKENPASIRCLAMLLRCLRDSSTDPLRLMSAALRFTTVELRMLTMPPRFDRTLVQFKPASRPLTNPHDLVVDMRQSQGGGGVGGVLSFFFSRLGPSIYRSPPTPPEKKQQEFQEPPKIFEILATPKNIPILYLDLKKDPKMHRNDP